ncbi:MAG: twin-arginine translocase TatA/TatE family subunit [Candidatus Eisenbacteria bacterium]|nr:twin-arginine translocase TatA/TatE family subunit [Candidatus Latescibacterota bacterium]MBD3301940.1 twin-arginine translocase TatA/TatE family subunit [Candidatus Eisenbacteria bacterium]
MGPLGFREILIILLIILILFGAKRIPELARSLGRGINEFKGGMKSGEEGEQDSKKVEEPNEAKERKG